MQNFEDIKVQEEIQRHKKDLNEFVTNYIEVLKMLGGKEMVDNFNTEMRYRQLQGADYGEAVIDHYEITKKRFGL